MAAPITGQITVSGSAQALSATALNVTAFVIKAPSSNGNPVFIGPAGVTTGTGYQLDPGDDFEYERSAQIGSAVYPLSVSDFYVVGTASDKVAWLASPGSV